MASLQGFHDAFLALTAATLVGLTVFVAMSRPVDSPSKPRNVVEAYRYLARPPRGFALVLGYVSLDRFAWSLWFPMLSAHLYASGYQEDQVGYIITLSGIIQTLLLPVAGRAADRIGSWAMLAASEAAGSLAAILYSTPEPWQRVAMAAVLMGVSIAAWVPGYNTLIAKVAGGPGGAYAAANTARSLMGGPGTIRRWIPIRCTSALGPLRGEHSVTSSRHRLRCSHTQEGRGAQARPPGRKALSA